MNAAFVAAGRPALPMRQHLNSLNAAQDAPFVGRAYPRACHSQVGRRHPNVIHRKAGRESKENPEITDVSRATLRGDLCCMNTEGSKKL